MRIGYKATGSDVVNWLSGTPWLPETWHSRPSGLSMPGAFVGQEVQTIRGASPTYFDRGNLARGLSFSTTRLFETAAEAERYAMAYDAAHARQGDVLIVIDDGTNDGQGTQYKLSGALIDPPAFRFSGATLHLDYTIRGGALASVSPSEWLLTSDRGGVLLFSNHAFEFSAGTQADYMSWHTRQWGLGVNAVEQDNTITIIPSLADLGQPEPFFFHPSDSNGTPTGSIVEVAMVGSLVYADLSRLSALAQIDLHISSWFSRSFSSVGNSIITALYLTDTADRITSIKFLSFPQVSSIDLVGFGAMTDDAWQAAWSTLPDTSGVVAAPTQSTEAQAIIAAKGWTLIL